LNILDRYIVRSMLGTILLVLMVLLGLRSFIEFVGQLDDLGNDYTLVTIAIYVALRAPGSIFDMLPAAALLGSLLGLGSLATHSELVVMRASGVSRLRLLGSAGLAGILLLIVMALLGESIAPSAGQYARELRAAAMHQDISIGGGPDTWLKQGDVIVNLRQRTDDFAFGGVLLFELGAKQNLLNIGRAESANVDQDQRWILDNFAETRFSDAGLSADTVRRAVTSYEISPDLLGLSVVRPDLLDTPTLWRYIAHLQANDLEADRYRVAFWSRIANVFSVAVMTVLALPFVFGSLRAAGAGARLLVGVLIGLGYFLATQTLVSSGEVFDLNPVVVAWLPTVTLLAITGIAVSRIR